jgi:hypothetical protein
MKELSEIFQGVFGGPAGNAMLFCMVILGVLTFAPVKAVQQESYVKDMYPSKCPKLQNKNSNYAKLY